VCDDHLQKSRDMATAVATQNPAVRGDGNTEQHGSEFLTHFGDSQHALSPSEGANTTRNKELGQSSKTLKVDDFDLVRTLGTGE
jgi:hypothetical protein